MNGNSFSYERQCTKTRFEKEVQGNSELAYLYECQGRGGRLSETQTIRVQYCLLVRGEEKQ